MNIKKFVLTLISVFVLLEITNYLIHGVILSAAYLGLTQVFRSQNEMMSMMWLMYIMDLIWSFFFVFFFVKGYENKGVMEGLRFGFYMGVFVSLVYAYGSYVVYPIPYSLALSWFIYGMIQSLLLGITAALVYKPKQIVAAAPSAA